jgi:hypothetical protein
MLSFCFGLFSIEVSGEQSGTWTQENSPYIVTGNVVVPAGQILTIQPGVSVLFNNDTQLTVNGQISAIGTINDSIRFQTNDNGFWNGLKIESSMENNKIFYCYFTEVGDNHYAVSSVESRIKIRFCHIENCIEGIQFFDMNQNEPPQMEILNSKINTIQKSGIYIVGNSNALISGNDISYCGLGTQYYGAIQLATQNDSHQNTPTIQNNRIHNNGKQGITEANILNSGYIEATIVNNVIENNLTGIYFYNGHGQVRNNIIRDNFEEGNENSGAGVMLYGSNSYATFSANDIYGNYTGFYIINDAGANIGNLNNDCTDDDGLNKIHDNFYQGFPSSIYCNTSQNISAENNFWGTTNTNEIDASIMDGNDNSGTGIVDYQPIFDPSISCSISGNLSCDEENSVQYYGIGLFPEGESIDSEPTAYDLLTETGEFNIYLNEPGNYYLVCFGFYFDHFGDPDFDHYDLVTAYGGVSSPQIISLNIGDVLTNINLNLTSEKPTIHLSVDDNFQENGQDIYKLWVDQFINLNQFAFNLYHEDNATKIYAFSYMEDEEEQMIPVDQEAIFVPDNLNIGDTFITADMGENGIQYQNVECVGTQNLQINGTNKTAYILDYSYGDIPTSRRWFVNGIGMVRFNEYDEEDGFSTYTRFSIMDLSVNDNPIMLPLELNNYWTYSYTESPNKPDFLWSKAMDNNEYHLSWCPPRFVDSDTWICYNLYKDGNLIQTIPADQNSVNIENDGTHEYYLTVVSDIGESQPTNTIEIGVVENSDNHVNNPGFVLSQNYPNPFNPSGSERGNSTTISFTIPSDGNVNIAVYNIKGQKIKSLINQEYSKGNHRIIWNGKDDNNKIISSGVYFYRLKSGKYTSTKKILILK